MKRRHPRDFSNPRNAAKRQWQLVKDLWHARSDGYSHLFGIEWFTLTFLAVIQFLLPTLYFRTFFGRKYEDRKLTIEKWAIGKPVVLCAFLFFAKDVGISAYLGAYSLADLYAYLLGLVFLKDYYSRPISHNRNLILLQVNFLESACAFALLYQGTHSLQTSAGISVNQPLDILYFSFITAATVGYGDIIPTSRSIPILQVLASFVFAGVVLTTFLSRAQDGEVAGTKNSSERL